MVSIPIIFGGSTTRANPNNRAKSIAGWRLSASRTCAEGLLCCVALCGGQLLAVCCMLLAHCAMFLSQTACHGQAATFQGCACHIRFNRLSDERLLITKLLTTLISAAESRRKAPPDEVGGGRSECAVEENPKPRRPPSRRDESALESTIKIVTIEKLWSPLLRSDSLTPWSHKFDMTVAIKCKLEVSYTL
jgi:hypothetical protein